MQSQVFHTYRDFIPFCIF